MIRVEVNNGQFVEDYDISDVPTIGDIVKKFQDDHRFRFAATPVIFDAPNNRVTDFTEATVDDRVYAMTCWITQQLDENGEPIKRSLLI